MGPVQRFALIVIPCSCLGWKQHERLLQSANSWSGLFRNTKCPKAEANSTPWKITFPSFLFSFYVFLLRVRLPYCFSESIKHMERSRSFKSQDAFCIALLKNPYHGVRRQCDLTALQLLSFLPWFNWLIALLFRGVIYCQRLGKKNNNNNNILIQENNWTSTLSFPIWIIYLICFCYCTLAICNSYKVLKLDLTYGGLH